jgi:hypothetical protein
MSVNQVPVAHPSFSVLVGAGAVSNGTAAQNATAAAGGGAAFVVTANVIPGVYSGGSSNVSGISCGNSVNPMSGDIAAFGVTSQQSSFIVYADAAWTSRASIETATTRTTLNLVGNSSIFAYAANVLGSTDNFVKTSTDGLTWVTRVTFGTTSTGPLSVANNIFFFGGFGTAVRTSTDGITWATRTVPLGSVGAAGPVVAFGNATYVAVGAGGGVATSTDAITWTTRFLTGTPITQCDELQYGAAGFIASRNATVAYAYSTDGITWSTRSFTTDVGTAPKAVITDGTKYIVFTSSATISKVFSSTNFTTWTQIANSPFIPAINENASGYLNGTFIISDDNSSNTVIAVSTDAITWVTKNANINCNAIGYGNSRFMAVNSDGVQLSTSVDVSGPVVNTAVVNLIGTKPTAIF